MGERRVAPKQADPARPKRNHPGVFGGGVVLNPPLRRDAVTVDVVGAKSGRRLTS